MAVIRTIEKVSDHIDSSDIIPGSLDTKSIWRGPVDTDIKIEPYVSPGVIGCWPDLADKGGAELSYHGHRLGDIEDIIDDVEKANSTVKKWALPGVENIRDIKKAPREITKIMLEAVTRIAMYKSTLDIAFEFEKEIWERVPRCHGKSLDRPGFMMAIAYDAMRFGEDDINDPVVQAIFHQLWVHRDELSDGLEHEIEKLEKKAVGAK